MIPNGEQDSFLKSERLCASCHRTLVANERRHMAILPTRFMAGVHELGEQYSANQARSSRSLNDSNCVNRLSTGLIIGSIP